MRVHRALILGIGIAVVSCAPIQSATVISRAEEELRTARLAGADQLAPYEFTKADLYLKMAKERQGFSDFEAAKMFAEEAQRLAVAAKQNAPINLRLQQRRAVPVSPAAEEGR